MKRGKSVKSQVGIEFLMTYGWAILILGVIVGAIYTFGWFNPNDILPQKCEFYGQVGCRDFYVSKNAVNLSVVNNFGANLYIGKVVLVNDEYREYNCTKTYDGVNAIYWQRNKFNMTNINLNDTACSDFQSKIITGNRVKLIASIYYYNYDNCPACKDNSLTHSDCAVCLHNSVGRLNVGVN